MSYRRRHRWFRRMALGLAFASVMVAGRASVAAAKIDSGTDGSRYVVAGGWSGEVDPESGIPITAGIPEGDEQFIDEQGVEVIPYLSHGILTQEEANAAKAQAIHDPYLTDVFVRQGESLGGADGDAIAFANALESQQQTVIPYLSHGLVTQADADAAAAEAIHDLYPSSTLRGGKAEQLAMIPYLSHGLLTQADVAAKAVRDLSPSSTLRGGKAEQLAMIPYLSQGLLTQAEADAASAEGIHDPFFPNSALESGLDGDEIAFANAIVTAADSLHDPVTESLATSEQFVPGVTDFPTTALQTAALRPDDWANRFAHSDVPPRPQMVSSDSGATVDWNQALMVGFGALVLILGLGLAIGYLRRPRLAGL